MDFKDIFKIIRKYLLIILACEIAVVGAAFVIVWRQPSAYLAVSKIQVKTQGKMYGGYDQYPMLAEMSALDGYRNVQTQAEVLKSRRIRTLTEDRLHLTPKQKTMLVVKVSPEQDSDVLKIDVTSTDKELARLFANALPQEYLADGLAQQRQEAKKQANFYEEKKQKVEEDLDEARSKLEAYKTQEGIEDLETETKSMLNTASDFQKMLSDAQVELSSTRRRLEESERELPNQSAIRFKDVLVANPLLSDLKIQQARIEVEYAKALQKTGPEHPDVKAIRKQLAEIKSKLKEEAYSDMIVGSRSSERNQTHDDLTWKIAGLKAEALALETKVASLSQLVQERSEPLKTLPSKEKEINILEMNVATLKEQSDILNKKYEDFRLSKDVPSETGTIIELADYAIDTNKSRKMLSLIISIMGGFFIGMVFAFVREYMDETIYTTEDVEEALQLVVIGQIPLEKGLGKDIRTCADKPNTPIAESFRALRNRLKYILAEQDIRMFMVTSSSVREGKSFTSLNLAITMALHGHKVLLVDADLRRSTVHKSFGVDNKGISNVIIDGQDVMDFIVETEIPNLSILPAGPLPLSETTPVISSEIFESRRIGDMFNILAISFDYIVVDTPPVMAVTDVMALAPHIKALLFVVSSGEMQRSDVVKSKRLIESTGIKIIGAVLNRTRHSVSYYRYLYYYYDKDTGSKKKRKGRY